MNFKCAYSYADWDSEPFELSEASFTELTLCEQKVSTPKQSKGNESIGSNSTETKEAAADVNSSKSIAEINRDLAIDRAEKRKKLLKFIGSFGTSGEQLAKLKRNYTYCFNYTILKYKMLQCFCVNQFLTICFMI